MECPLHATRFCLADGVPQCLPATKPVATHQVEIRGDEVYLRPGVPALSPPAELPQKHRPWSDCLVHVCSVVHNGPVPTPWARHT